MVLGVFFAFRLSRLKCTQLMQNINESIVQAQGANKEILEKRFGNLGSQVGPAQGEGLLEIVANPIFGLMSFVVAVMLLAHPDFIAAEDFGRDLSAKAGLLLFGFIFLGSMFFCSIALKIIQWRKG